MGMEVAGQRLTFPFPFVHQQPHDCGNKTINRWETSLWNLSYNLSAVNLVSLSLLFPTFYCLSSLLDRREEPHGGETLRTPLYALLPKGGGSTSRSKLISSFIFSFSLLFFVWKGKSIEEKMKEETKQESPLRMNTRNVERCVQSGDDW